ncbi:metallophosphoesterase [Bradyrhizobium sp. 160]|uniref:metallophosphoesterase n=1 Tax=Bradyrhizobium sp. 160 TaxID=2782634 RepID=UPI001FF84587|nr:metallophosphoesterase [Bradyrhizobium sp. 160]MCK1621769.1 metallophosphoesterase [Bradyrhizobium sp. 160]
MKLKLQISSDLHIGYPGARGFPPLVSGTDIVLIAGDTCEGLQRAIREMRAAYPNVEIVTCAGNHEFYGGSYFDQLAEGRECARELGVHLLEDGVATFGRLRILGCTLWTDYDLLGRNLRDGAMLIASEMMRDHKRIKWQRNPWKRFRPIEARLLHQRSRVFLEAELARDYAGTTITMTHAAPTLDHIAPPNRSEMISAAFASRLDELIDRFQPHYWISGHVHYPVDFFRGRTRLISNPCGYADEVAGYNPSFTIEVDA